MPVLLLLLLSLLRPLPCSTLLTLQLRLVLMVELLPRAPLVWLQHICCRRLICNDIATSTTSCLPLLCQAVTAASTSCLFVANQQHQIRHRLKLPKTQPSL